MNPQPTASQFEQLSDLLEWLALRATPLGAGALCIASLLWVHFRHEFGLPVGFADGSVLAALPALIAITFSCVGVLAGALSFPAQVLTTKLHAEGPTLASVFQSATTASGNGTPDPAMDSLRTSLIWRWVAITVLFGITWSACIAWASLNPELETWKPLLIFIPVIALSIHIIRPVAKTVARDKAVSRWYYVGLAQAFVFQALLAFFSLYVILRGATEVDVADLAGRAVWFLGILFLVAMMQLAIARRIIRGWYPNLLKHLVCMAFLAVTFVAMIPPVGARIAGFALLSSATPRQLCTVFSVRPQPADAPWVSLLNDKNKGKTRRMTFVFPFNGVFFVKENAQGTTYVLDAKEVASTEACVDDKGGQPEKNAQARRGLSPSGASPQPPHPAH